MKQIVLDDWKWTRNLCRFEWKPQDAWIGAFWKVTTLADEPTGKFEVLDVWVCILPMLPLHLQFTRQWVVFDGGDAHA